MVHLTRLITMCAMWSVAAGHLPAQTATPTVGSRVKVTSGEPAVETIGRVIAVDSAELVLQVGGDSAVVRVPRASVQQLWVSTKHSTNGSRIPGGILGGGALGLGAAAIIGATNKSVICDEVFGTTASTDCRESDAAEKVIVGAFWSVLTVPLGMGLGILMSLGGDRDSWLEQRLTVQASTLPRGQRGVGLSLRW